MLKINLIEQVAKQQEVLNTKNKVSSDFVQKTLYYSEEFPVTKAVATNTGNINASDMMGTQTVFPSDKAGADGEYLIYLMPRFVRGRNVYRLFNTESSKQINNTVKVSNSSLGNYVYQVDQTSTPEQAKEEGETVEVENTERSVERNRSNKIKPLQEGETPEQYQERFMKEYQDLVRDINGALSDIDPEQVLKQWQKKQEEIEKQKETEQAVSVVSTLQQGVLSVSGAITAFSENSCSLHTETAKSIFFEKSILKNTTTAICDSAVETLVKFLEDMGGTFARLQIELNNPFDKTTGIDIKAFAIKLLNNEKTKERVLEMVDALKVLTAKEKPNKPIDPSHKIIFAYLLFNDILGIQHDGSIKADSGIVIAEPVRRWAQSIQEKISQFQINALVNELQTNRDVPFSEGIVYVEQITDLAKVMVETALIDVLVSPQFGKYDISAYALEPDKRYALLQKRLKALGDAARPVESFFGKFSLNMLKVQLGKYLTKEELAALDIQHDIGSGLTPEEQQELDNAAKNNFENLGKEQIEKYAGWMQRQIPTWLISSAGENTSQETLLKMHSLCKEGGEISEEELDVSDLPAFSRGGDEPSVQFDTPEIVEVHAQIGSYKDKEFVAFVNAYVDNLGTKLGLTCNQPRDTEEKSKCNRLTAHVHFILGRIRTSGPGSMNDKGETFEEILALDQLFRMLPDVTKHPEDVRFNGKSGIDAVMDYLRCNSSDKRHYLTASDSADITPDKTIEIFDDTEEKTASESIAAITVEELTSEVLDGFTAQAIAKEAKEIEIKATYIRTNAKGQVIPQKEVESSNGTKTLEPQPAIPVYFDTGEYTTKFSDEITPLLQQYEAAVAANDKEKKKQLREEIDKITFEYLTLGLINQETINTSSVLSGITHMLETHFAGNASHLELLKSVFKGKINHIKNYLNKYGKFIFTKQKFTKDDIRKLLAAQKYSLKTLTTLVAGKRVMAKILKTKIGKPPISLNDWISEFARSEAKKLRVSGLDADAYISHFKDSVTIRMQKLIESSGKITQEDFLLIVSQARLDGTRAVIGFMNPDTPVDALYTLESQEDFLQQLEQGTYRPETKEIISAKGKILYDPQTLKGKRAAEERMQRVGKGIEAKAEDNSIKTGVTTKNIKVDGKLIGKRKEVKSFDALKEQIKEIWGENSPYAKGRNAAQVIRSVVDKERVIRKKGASTILTEEELADLDTRLRRIAGGDSTAPTFNMGATPVVVSAKKQLDKDGNVVTVKTNKTQEVPDPDNPGKMITQRVNQEEEVELHTLTIEFTIGGETYVIEVNQPAPPAYRYDPSWPSNITQNVSAITSSIVTIDNLVLKAINFERNAESPYQILGENCPATAVVDSSGQKQLNPNAMLTIEDNEGVTFFNVSKLHGIPGGSSGFADLAHFKIKGLSRKTGNFERKKKKDSEDLEDVELAVTVVEGKVGGEKPTLTSFGRIEAIQTGIVSAVLAPDKENLKAIKKARYDVFVGRSFEGRISYGRAQNNRISDQLGRIAIQKPTVQPQPAAKQKTTSINSNNLQKILKSIWL